MHHPFFKGVVLGAITASLVLMAGTAMAGSGIGAIFNLGKTNSVNKTSSLAGTTSSRMLQVTNKGSGAALGLAVRAGKAPLVVNSKAMVANLNADTVDGDHSFFSRKKVSLPYNDFTATIVTVPGFGHLDAELWTSGALGQPTFYNSEDTENVEVCFGGMNLNASVAPNTSWKANVGWDTSHDFDLFLADSKHTASLNVHWWLDGSAYEVITQGVAR